MNNILLIKLRYIGDVLLATPVLRALREGYPAARLTMAVLRGTEPVVRHHPDVDDVLIVDRLGWRADLRFARALRARRFDAVIDLTDSDRSALLTLATAAPVRLGFNWEHFWRGLLYTRVVPHREGVHRVERDLDAVRALGLSPTGTAPVLRVGPEDEAQASRVLREHGVRDGERLIVLHPGARYWFKAWPVERFAELARRLSLREGARVVVAGGDGDRAAVEQIAKEAGGGTIAVAGALDLLPFAALLKRAELFVGNDNGAMHMAAALGVPVVGLFGPSNPVEWGPLGARTAVLYKGMDCRACFHPTCPRGELNCMRQISVEEVYEAAVGLLHAAARP